VRNEHSPEQVRAMCARLAWDQSLPATHRAAFEKAADTIRAQHDRLMRVSKSLEASEMQTALLRAVAYGPQKGGAA
jgi:hypothetical protein